MPRNRLLSIRLLNARATDGTDGYVTWNYSGRAILLIQGTPAGASVGLSVLSPDGTTDITVRDEGGAIAAYGATGTYPIPYIAKGQDIKATISGATGSTSLTAYLIDADHGES